MEGEGGNKKEDFMPWVRLSKRARGLQRLGHKAILTPKRLLSVYYSRKFTIAELNWQLKPRYIAEVSDEVVLLRFSTFAGLRPAAADLSYGET